MKRSKSIKRGKNFLAFGLGKYGPYMTYTRRIAGRTYAKASIGTKGALVGIKYSGKSISTQGMHNLSTGSNSFSLKRKSRRY